MATAEERKAIENMLPVAGQLDPDSLKALNAARTDDLLSSGTEVEGLIDRIKSLLEYDFSIDELLNITKIVGTSLAKNIKEPPQFDTDDDDPAMTLEEARAHDPNAAGASQSQLPMGQAERNTDFEHYKATRGFGEMPPSTPLLGVREGLDENALNTYLESIPRSGAAGRYAGGQSIRNEIGRIADDINAGMIYEDDVYSRISDVIGAGSQSDLAMEMYLFVPGAYRDIDDVMLDNGEINPTTFQFALQSTLDLAEMAGPDEFGSMDENSIFIDILMGNADASPQELQAMFAQKKAEIEAEEKGPGKVIRLIDPVSIKRAAKELYSEELGRYATAQEKKAAIKMIHSLQKTGAEGIDVAGRISEEARRSNAVEAGAMDYGTGAGLMMEALRIGGMQ